MAPILALLHALALGVTQYCATAVVPYLLAALRHLGASEVDRWLDGIVCEFRPRLGGSLDIGNDGLDLFRRKAIVQVAEAPWRMLPQQLPGYRRLGLLLDISIPTLELVLLLLRETMPS
eukprot:6785166-Pyramimonas_sp.AAC.1